MVGRAGGDDDQVHVGGRQAGRVERTVDFVGTLRANAEAEVATEVDGRLLSIDANLGDQVKEGQVLASLDSATLDAQVREATANQGAWFDRWVAWARDHAYGRQVIPAVALYMNDPADSLSQIRRALADAPGRPKAAGIALYSYGATRPVPSDTASTTRAESAELWAALAEPGPFNSGQPPFASRTSPPGLAWKQGILSQSSPAGTP